MSKTNLYREESRELFDGLGTYVGFEARLNAGYVDLNDDKLVYTQLCGVYHFEDKFSMVRKLVFNLRTKTAFYLEKTGSRKFSIRQIGFDADGHPTCKAPKLTMPVISALFSAMARYYNVAEAPIVDGAWIKAFTFHSNLNAYGMPWMLLLKAFMVNPRMVYTVVPALHIPGTIIPGLSREKFYTLMQEENVEPLVYIKDKRIRFASCTTVSIFKMLNRKCRNKQAKGLQYPYITCFINSLEVQDFIPDDPWSMSLIGGWADLQGLITLFYYRKDCLKWGKESLYSIFELLPKTFQFLTSEVFKGSSKEVENNLESLLYCENAEAFPVYQGELELEENSDCLLLTVAKTTADLNRIGKTMHNCITLYIGKATRKHCTILSGRCVDKKVCIELLANRINQCYGFANSILSEKEQQVILGWANKNHLLIDDESMGLSVRNDSPYRTIYTGETTLMPVSRLRPVHNPELQCIETINEAAKTLGFYKDPDEFLFDEDDELPF